jgi:LPXTG-site transpeptidase (sortase) family protein
MKKDRIQGLALVFIGLTLIIIYFTRSYSKRVLSFNNSDSSLVQVEKVEKKIYAKPISLEIPSLKINLPVEESQIVDEVWRISEKGASHLNTSASPGEGGNVVLYAHNKKLLFGLVRQVKKDAEILVSTEDKKSWKYKVIETVIVTPDDISYVLPKSEETLTLYTCTGFADSKRFIVIAKPE